MGLGAGMTVPSGAFFGPEDLSLVRQLGEVGFIRWGDTPFSLKSGIKSHVYVFGREDLTDHPDVLLQVGNKIRRDITGQSPADQNHTLIGIPVCGSTLAEAAAISSLLFTGDPKKMNFRVMRQQPKKHGAHNQWVEGPYDPSRAHWTVDNVITRGDSKDEMNPHLIESGYPSQTDPSGNMGTYIFVDRQQGGVKLLEESGYRRVVVGYNLLDLTYAFAELGIWDKSSVEKVEQEIALHQF